MDLIIKNLEYVRDFENKAHPKAITIDIKKVIEDSIEFSEAFEKSCEKYKEPSLKEVTERMQSEFDATGIDTKIFMNERVIKR